MSLGNYGQAFMAATDVTRVGGPTVEKSRFQLEDQEQRPNHRCYYYLGLPPSPGLQYSYNCPPAVPPESSPKAITTYRQIIGKPALGVYVPSAHGAPTLSVDEFRARFTRRSMRSSVAVTVSIAPVRVIDPPMYRYPRLLELYTLI